MLSRKDIENILDSSKRLQSCTSSYDHEELLLANPEFLQNLLANCSSPRLINLLSRSKQYLFDNQTVSGVFYSSTQNTQRVDTLSSIVKWLPETMSNELRTNTDTLCLKLQNIWNGKQLEQWDAKVVGKGEDKVITKWRSRVVGTPIVFVPFSLSFTGVLSNESLVTTYPKVYSLVCNKSMYTMSNDLQKPVFTEEDVTMTVTFYLDESLDDPGKRQCIITNRVSSELVFRGFSVESTKDRDKFDLFLHGSDQSEDSIESLDTYTYYTFQVSYNAEHSWYTLQKDRVKIAYRKPFRSVNQIRKAATLYLGAELSGGTPANMFCGQIVEVQITRNLPRVLCDFVLNECLILNSYSLLSLVSPLPIACEMYRTLWLQATETSAKPILIKLIRSGVQIQLQVLCSVPNYPLP
jgi:hypothetical protein